MQKKKVTILYEDRDILVCEKPQGMPVQSDKTVSVDLLHYLKSYLYEKEKKGEPEIYLIHRLDQLAEFLSLRKIKRPPPF